MAKNKKHWDAWLLLTVFCYNTKMPPHEDNGRIEELKNSLYSRTAPDVRTRRRLRFSPSKADVKTSWEEKKEESIHPVLNTEYEDHSMSFMVKFLIGSIVFCIIAVGVGAYIFFNGANLISGNNIDIVINGPVSIPGGETVPFDISVLNKNNVDLELVDLSVDFPAGATDPKNSTQELKTYRELLGDIPAGGKAEKIVSAIIFGEENLQKQIVATVTYKVKGSNSLFTKSKSYDVLINSSPINLTVNTVKETTSRQEFTMTVSIKSNSGDVLKGVLLKADYPFGYTFLSSNPNTILGNSTWRIGDIPPGAERKVTIVGKLEGEDSDSRAFHFTAGAESSASPKTIGTQYMSIEQDMAIQKPFISLNISIDGDNSTADRIGEFGQTSRVDINWFNNLPVSVSNLEIRAKLSGSAYDKTKVSVDQGIFQSATNEVVWNQQTNPKLLNVGSGDDGTVSFSIIPSDTGGARSNPIIGIDVSVAGDRTQESGVSGALSSVASRNIRVSSNVSLTGRTVRSVGPFVNTGPIPPKADNTTTYTIIWTIDNTSSSVYNAQVVGVLPAYVKWLKAVDPSTEQVSYDSNTGKVTWNVGTINANTNSANRRTVAFQVAFQPSVAQVGGGAPSLISESVLTGIDNFTGQTLTSKQDALTTRFSTDPAYKDGNENVIK